MITMRGFRQPLQPLQVAGDSDSEGAASSSDPPLRVLATATVSGHVGVKWGSGGADGCNDGDHCDVAVATGRAQPLLVAGESSDSDLDEYHCALSVATAAGNVDQPRLLATASDDEGSLASVATAAGNVDQPRLLATASDDEGSVASVATAADNADLPRLMATASDDEGSLAVGDEGTSSGPPLSKRARCSTPPPSPAAKSKQDAQSLFFGHGLFCWRSRLLWDTDRC